MINPYLWSNITFKTEQTMEPPIRVIIADNHSRSRSGLKALLSTFPQIEIIGEAKNGQEAVNLVDSLHPDVILIDVQMPVLNGLEATRQIKKDWPQVKVVVLSLDTTQHKAALAAQADTFITKGGPVGKLWNAILT